jgi:hypothetical protein
MLFDKFTQSCFVMLLVLSSQAAFADHHADTMTDNEAKVTDVVIPLSGSHIKQNAIGPKRGTSMKTVQATYGQAIKVHPPKGKPPITRWDYPEFSVTLNPILSFTLSAALTDQYRTPS